MERTKETGQLTARQHLVEVFLPMRTLSLISPPPLFLTRTNNRQTIKSQHLTLSPRLWSPGPGPTSDPTGTELAGQGTKQAFRSSLLLLSEDQRVLQGHTVTTDLLVNCWEQTAQSFSRSWVKVTAWHGRPRSPKAERGRH